MPHIIRMEFTSHATCFNDGRSPREGCRHFCLSPKWADGNSTDLYIELMLRGTFLFADAAAGGLASADSLTLALISAMEGARPY